MSLSSLISPVSSLAHCPPRVRQLDRGRVASNSVHACHGKKSERQRRQAILSPEWCSCPEDTPLLLAGNTCPVSRYCIQRSLGRQTRVRQQFSTVCAAGTILVSKAAACIYRATLTGHLKHRERKLLVYHCAPRSSGRHSRPRPVCHVPSKLENS